MDETSKPKSHNLNFKVSDELHRDYKMDTSKNLPIAAVF
jgi:hypothetical protein